MDKELDEAEKEVTRTQNILKHQDEIKSRPKRTWFQTEREKKETRKKDLEYKTKRSKKQE